MIVKLTLLVRLLRKGIKWNSKYIIYYFLLFPHYIHHYKIPEKWQSKCTILSLKVYFVQSLKICHLCPSVFSWEPLLALNPTTGLLSLHLLLNFKIVNFFFNITKGRLIVSWKKQFILPGYRPPRSLPWHTTLGWSHHLTKAQLPHPQNWDNVWQLTKADGWMRSSFEVTSGFIICTFLVFKGLWIFSKSGSLCLGRDLSCISQEGCFGWIQGRSPPWELRGFGADEGRGRKSRMCSHELNHEPTLCHGATKHTRIKN